jgi:hypothetical protein
MVQGRSHQEPDQMVSGVFRLHRTGIGTQRHSANGGVSARGRVENKAPLTRSGALWQSQNPAKNSVR